MWLDNFLSIHPSSSRIGKIAKLENDRGFLNQFMRLWEIAYTRYDINGIPDTADKRVVLQSLICYGNVVFFRHSGEILALPGAMGGNYNVYGQPLDAQVFSRNGRLNRNVRLYVPGGIQGLEYGLAPARGAPEGVMVWENKMRYPAINYIFQFARSISDCFRTLDVTRTWLKMPAIISAEESLIPSLKKLLENVKENRDIVPVSSGIMSVDRLSITPTGDVSSSVQKSCELVDWYEQQFRVAIGLAGNQNIDKKGENLISDEVRISREPSRLGLSEVEEYLSDQFDFVNECLGTDISISIPQENIEVKGDAEYGNMDA